MRKLIFLGITLVLCLSIGAKADIIYTGSLSLLPPYTDTNPGGLFGVGFESTDDATLAWEVSRDQTDPSDPWHYKYTLSFVPNVDKAISHIAIEVSDNFDSLFNLRVSPPDYYTAGAPEPGTEPTSQDWVPGHMFAIKFDADPDVDVVDSLTIQFDSWRVPDWGDFNAKGGNMRNGGWYLYNLGYDENATDDNDPIFNPGLATLDLASGNYIYDGSVDYHVVVPDTHVVPVPASILLGILGLSAVGIKLRKVA